MSFFVLIDSDGQKIIEQVPSIFNGYRPIGLIIDENELSVDLRNKINSPNFDDSLIQQAIQSLQTNKADKTDLALYRLKSVKIGEPDLTTQLQDKINEVYNSMYDDTEVRDLISSLQLVVNGKADTSDLSQYRRKDTAIVLTDLSQELVNTIISWMDKDAIYEAISLKISYNDAVQMFRKNSDFITEGDIDAEIMEKINNPQILHDKILARNADPEFLHITEAEKNKFNGYEDLLLTAINDIQNMKLEIHQLRTAEPVIFNNAINGQMDVSIEGMSLLAYTIDSRFPTQIVSPAQITIVPNIIRAVPYITEDVIYIPVNTPSYSTTYTVSIPEGVILADNGKYNSIGVQTVFRTTDSIGMLSGYVRDENSNVVPGVTVTITKDAFTASTTTDLQGFYEFDNVNAGSGYTITFSMIGYTEYSEIITIIADVNTKNVSLESEANPVVWSIELTLAHGAYSIDLDNIPAFAGKTMTDIDVYGTGDDGNGVVELRWIGYVGNRMYDPDGVYHPLAYLEDGMSKLSPDGRWQYDGDTKVITFVGGSSSTKIYRLVKYLNPRLN